MATHPQKGARRDERRAEGVHARRAAGERERDVAALQSDVGRSLLMHHGRAASDISSSVLVDEQRAALKSEAVLRIAKDNDAAMVEDTNINKLMAVQKLCLIQI